MGASRVSGLTELDLCVLGNIWRWGPVSAYRVRTVFRDSTTAAWSSSAGSIYPSIKRLLAAGLVTAGTLRDKRGTQELTVTPQGMVRLREWLVLLTPDVGSATPDPIRTRSQFLTSISGEDRARFVEGARMATLEALRQQEAAAEIDARNPDRILDQLGTLGAIYELRARLAWLDKVVELLPPDS